MKRRTLLKYGATGVVTLATSSLLVKSSEAFVFGFILRALTSRLIFNSVLRGVAGTIINSLNARSQEELLAIQIADRDFIRRQFTENRTNYAQAQTNLFWGQERVRNDVYLRDLGFGFVETVNSSSRVAMLGSPVVTGIHAAIQFLRDRGLSSIEINQSIMPTRTQINELCSWTGTNASNVCSANYRTVLGEAFFRYEVVHPGSGGHGNIKVLVDAAGFPRRTLDIRVDFT